MVGCPVPIHLYSLHVKHGELAHFVIYGILVELCYFAHSIRFVGAYSCTSDLWIG